MHWLAKYRQKLLLQTAIAAGPLAYVAAVSGGAPATLATAGVVAAGVLSDVVKNLLSDEARDALKQPVDTRFNHDLQKALATALVNVLGGSAATPGPLLSRLRAAGFDLRQSADLVGQWRRHVEDALAPDSSLRKLDALFPPATTEEQLLAYARQYGQSELSLWQAFYDTALAPVGARRLELAGGAGQFREQVPALLMELFPAQFTAVLKDSAFGKSWIAYQKLCLQQIADAIDGHAADSAQQLQQIQAAQQTLQAAADRQLELLQSIASTVAAGRSDSLAKETAANDSLAPPLFVPETAADSGRGIQALRFSERLLQTIGRDEALQLLERFLGDPAPLLWWGIVGAAGMGKSHLALAAIDRLRGTGWRAGFLGSSAVTGWMDNEPYLRGWDPAEPTLIVIDYASTRTSSILRTLVNLWERRHTLRHPIRLLLLDRPGGLAPTFIELLRRRDLRSEDWSRLVAAAFRPAAAGGERRREAASVPAGGEIEFLELRPLARGDWRRMIEGALRGWGDNRALPADEDGFWNQVGDLSDNGRPLLLLVIAAQLADRADGQRMHVTLDEESRKQMLSALIERERTRIWADAVGIGHQAWEVDRTKYERGVAFVTLMRGVELSIAAESEALRRVMQMPVPDFLKAREHLASILGRDPGSDPRRRTRLRPLEPDLFGEYLLIWGTALDDWGFQPNIEVESIIAEALALDPRRACELLLLAARDFPTEISQWLAFALAAYRKLPAPMHEHSEDEAIEKSALVWLIGLHGPLLTRAGSTDIVAVLQDLRELSERSATDRYDAMLGLLGLADIVTIRWRRQLRTELHWYWPPRSLAEARLLARCYVAAMVEARAAREPLEVDEWRSSLSKLILLGAYPQDSPLKLSVLRGSLEFFASALEFETSGVIGVRFASLRAVTRRKLYADMPCRIAVVRYAIAAITADRSMLELRLRNISYWREFISSAVARPVPFRVELRLEVAECAYAVLSLLHRPGSYNGYEIERWRELLEALALPAGSMTMSLSTVMFRCALLGIGAHFRNGAPVVVLGQWRKMAEESSRHGDSPTCEPWCDEMLACLPFAIALPWLEISQPRPAFWNALLDRIAERIDANPDDEIFAVVAEALMLLVYTYAETSDFRLVEWVDRLALLARACDRHDDPRVRFLRAEAEVLAVRMYVSVRSSKRGVSRQLLEPEPQQKLRANPELMATFVDEVMVRLYFSIDNQRITTPLLEHWRTVLLAVGTAAADDANVRRRVLGAAVLAHEAFRFCDSNADGWRHLLLAVAPGTLKAVADDRGLLLFLIDQTTQVLASTATDSASGVLMPWLGLLDELLGISAQLGWHPASGRLVELLVAAPLAPLEKAALAAARLEEIHSLLAQPIAQSVPCVLRPFLALVPLALPAFETSGNRRALAGCMRVLVDIGRSVRSASAADSVPLCAALLMAVAVAGRMKSEMDDGPVFAVLERLTTETTGEGCGDLAALLLEHAQRADAETPDQVERFSALLQGLASSAAGADSEAVQYAACEDLLRRMRALAATSRVIELEQVGTRLIGIALSEVGGAETLIRMCAKQGCRVAIRVYRDLGFAQDQRRWSEMLQQLERWPLWPRRPRDLEETVECGDDAADGEHHAELHFERSPALQAFVDSVSGILWRTKRKDDWVAFADVLERVAAVLAPFDPDRFGGRSIEDLLCGLPYFFDVQQSSDVSDADRRMRLSFYGVAGYWSAQGSPRNEEHVRPTVRLNSATSIQALVLKIKAAIGDVVAGQWEDLASVRSRMQLLFPDFDPEQFGKASLLELVRRLPAWFEVEEVRHLGLRHRVLCIRMKSQVSPADDSAEVGDADPLSAQRLLEQMPGLREFIAQVDACIASLTLRNRRQQWASLSALGQLLLKADTSLRPQHFGYSGLSKLLQDLPDYYELQTKTSGRAKVNIVAVRIANRVEGLPP